MQLNVHPDQRLVEIWLTKAEHGDAALQSRLKPLYKRYKAKKYLVAVFISGPKDLEESTTGLLLHNQTIAAKRDLEKAKEAVS